MTLTLSAAVVELQFCALCAIVLAVGGDEGCFRKFTGFPANSKFPSIVLPSGNTHISGQVLSISFSDPIPLPDGIVAALLIDDR